MVLKRKIPVKLFLVLIGLIVFGSGCARQQSVLIHPLEDDFFPLPKQTNCDIIEYTVEDEDDSTRTVKAESKEIVKDGHFCSDYFLNEVMKARVD